MIKLDLCNIKIKWPFIISSNKSIIEVLKNKIKMSFQTIYIQSAYGMRHYITNYYVLYDGKEIFIQWSTDCTMSYDRPGIQFMIT